jgi:hypothetical protein
MGVALGGRVRKRGRTKEKPEPMNSNLTPNQPPKLVFTIVQTKNGKSAWIKLGAGWVNTDGSLNLKLDALPVNGTIQVRDNVPFEDRRAPFGALHDAEPTAAAREAFA